MDSDSAEALASEAKDGLTAGASVQILIVGYPTWLPITALWTHGDLRHAQLADGSSILIPKDAILGVRFGEIDEQE